MSSTEIGRKRLKQVFQYLEAFNQQRNPVIRQVEEQEWVLWMKSLPVHPTITRHKEGDDSFILKVGRAPLTPAPPPPYEIKDWLRSGWEDPFKPEKPIEVKTDKDHQGKEIKVRFEDSPERVNSYKLWKEERDAWATQERPARESYKIFERVYALYNRVEREAGRLELVLGDGILDWRLPDGEINHPILLKHVQLTFDPQAPEFTFQFTDQPVELYTALLGTDSNVDPKLIAQIRDECEKKNFYLSDVRATSEFLKGVVTRLAPGGEFIPEGGISGESANASNTPRIALGPVIIARQRTLGYARAIESILDEIPSLELDEIPLSLLSLTGVESPGRISDLSSCIRLDGGGNEDEEILFNKPANPEQLMIAKRLDHYGCVLVQGPPGTGKTHTIANLIGHLLAKGLSVLVTSHTTKALRVLRDKVDDRVKSLCVSLLDNDAEGQAQMSAAIGEIAERLNDDEAGLEFRLSEMWRTRAEIISELRLLRTRLYEARASEYRDISLDGKVYSPSQAARLVHEGRGVDDWIPRPILSDHCLPLDEDEVAELYQTNRAIPEEDEKYFTAPPLDPSLLIPSDEFHALLQERKSLDAARGKEHDEFWSAGIEAAPEILTELLSKIKVAVEPVVQGLNDPFKLAIINDSRRGGSYRAPWVELIEKIADVVEVAGSCRPLILNQGPQPAADIPHEQQAKALVEILAHLDSGGSLSKMTLLLHPEWKALIAQSRVDGKRPSEPAHFKALQAAVNLELLRTNLIHRWDRHLVPLGVPSANDFRPNPEEPCNQYVDLIRNLLSWYEDVWRPVEKELREVGFDWDAFLRGVPLNLQPNGDLIRLAEAVRNYLPPVFEARIIRLRRGEIERRIDDYRSQIRDLTAGGHSTELLGELLRVVESNDADTYSSIFDRIVDLHSRYQTYLRRCELLERLEQHASGWANAIRGRSGIHAGDVPPGDAQKAWLWLQLDDRLDEIAEESVADIQSEIERNAADLQMLTAELIETSAWMYQIGRTELKQKQALNGWVQTMRRIGKGTGKRVPELLAQAWSLMEDCRSAVPVWIMPLARVVENFQPVRGLFDVVIIDEASQCDVMGLITLYLGKKVIVVGDDEQVSPDAVGNTVEAAQNLINIYLQGIPNAELYDGKLSIYDLAMQSFGGTICLREHFRCVPEIIGFSNKLSYEGKIKPLRDLAHNPLSPAVIAHHVFDGQSNSKVNEREAETVASLIVAAIEQPEYEDQTFGVISLVGEDQAAAIERILRSKLDPAEFARRKITCGNAAQFQGDERHVMFLSVVDGHSTEPLRLRQEDLFKKRFNVAASRAKNQLWVVHSLYPAIDLKPGDLRRELIEYAENPKSQIMSGVTGATGATGATEATGANGTNGAEGADGPDGAKVSNSAKRPRAAKGEKSRRAVRTASDFEEQVMQWLIWEGYQVAHRWMVGAYCIDIVAGRGDRRVAVECDGDRRYAVDKIPEDMERQAVLERLGWRFIRIRGSQFFRDPQAVMKDVFDQLASLGVVPEMTAETAEVEEDELSARVIRRAEQLRAEWSGHDLNSISAPLDAQEAEPHWQISPQPEDPVLDKSDVVV
jgi:very-short-patch-repair endonuclease